MPEEANMKANDLIIFYNYLNYFVEINFAKKNFNQCIEILGKIQGYLLVADKKNYNEYFQIFIELKYVELLKILLENQIKDISYAILKTICFLTLNIENENLIKEIYSSKIINNVISIKFKIEDEFNEFLINFMKSLTLKLNKDNISYFYNYEINDFPLLTTAFGDIIVWEDNAYFFIIQYRYNNFSSLARGFKVFEKLLGETDYFFRKAKAKNFKEALQLLVAPAYDECFGYVPLLYLGGSEKPENLQKVKLREHLEIMFQIQGGI